MTDGLLTQVVRLVDAHQDLLADVSSPGLFGGQAGVALLYAHLYDVTNEEVYAESLTRLLHQLTDQLPNLAPHSTLTYGMAGVGWLLQHLVNRDLLDVDLAEMDRWVLDSLPGDSDRRNAELMTGLAGKGVYFLERGEAGRDGLRQVIDAIARSAEHVPAGITWPYASPYPDAPTYSLGLSHGVPGTISLLAKAHRRGVAPELTRLLLTESVAWLLQQRLAPGPPGAGQFAGYAGDHTPARLAWCYGDLSVAVALWQAATALDRADWHQVAIELVEGATHRALPDSGVRCAETAIDSGFCHGTAGLAHLFHRFQRVAPSAQIQQAAHYWLAQTQRATIRAGDGSASFQTYTTTDYTPLPDGSFALSWQTQAGLLEGITGVALVLLTFAAPDAPAWDGFLMTDLQPFS